MPAPNSKLTVKQTKFVKAYIENDGNGTQAALQSYNTVDEKTAGVIAVENLAKPSIASAIEEALQKHNITMDAAVSPIADGLKATKSFVIDDSLVETPDHATRLKASGMALKLMGADQKPDTPGTTFNFINNANFNSKKYVK